MLAILCRCQPLRLHRRRPGDAARHRLASLAVVGCLGLLQPSVARSGETTSGNWAAMRQRMIDAGITPEAVYVANMQTNPVGGERQGWAYAHYAAAALRFDFARLAGLNGLSLFAQGNWSAGDNLSASDIGNFFPVAHAYTGQQLALAQLYLQQNLLDDDLSLSLGRLTPNQTFAYLPIFANYLNSAVNLSPFALNAADYAFTGPPGAMWGTRAVVRFGDRWHVAGGAFLPDATAAVAGDNGLQFRFQPADGVMSVAEAGYTETGGAAGATLEIKAGGLYDSRRFARVGRPDGTVDDNYALYLNGQHLVYREENSGREGLSAWISAVYAPKERASPLPLFLATGAVYTGLLPGRSDDACAAGVFFGRFSRQLANQSAETVIEMSYTLRLASWLSLRPDVQYVITPGGRSGVADAAVFGGEIAVTF